MNADYTGEVWYSVQQPLSAGPHTATISFPDKPAGGRTYTWSFTVGDVPCPSDPVVQDAQPEAPDYAPLPTAALGENGDGN